MFIIGPAGLYSRRHRVGLRESRSALDAQIVFERPYIAHSSLPIYGSDTHLRTCSIAEMLAADFFFIKQTKIAMAQRVSARANDSNNGDKKTCMETSAAKRERRQPGSRFGFAGASPPKIFEASSAIKNERVKEKHTPLCLAWMSCEDDGIYLPQLQ